MIDWIIHEDVGCLALVEVHLDVHPLGSSPAIYDPPDGGKRRQVVQQRGGGEWPPVLTR